MKQLGPNKGHGQFCQFCNAWRGSLGLEPTPELYIQHIVQVFREVKRVLRKDGTVWLNLGDSYVGSGKASGRTWENGNIPNMSHKQASNPGSLISRMPDPPGLKPKDLCMIPARVALALQADGWWLRSDIIWAKPNPMPESVTDRPTRAHEYVFLLTKSAKYFYDADAVREPYEPASIERRKYPLNKTGKGLNLPGGASHTKGKCTEVLGPSQYSGRNLRSVWTIATEPTPEAHFATFPEKLVIPCIKAGTSEKGCCPECGAPWVRVVESHTGGTTGKSWHPHKDDLGEGNVKQQTGKEFETYQRGKTIGWRRTCKCRPSDIEEPHSHPCTVLDCFSGSGKVLTVAKKLFRKAIGIELNAEYCEMPVKKLKPGRLSF